MNYLKEILNFNEMLMTEPLSTGQISLWYALMYINNKCGWKKTFTVATSTLMTYTGMSERGIQNARTVLCEKGLISFKSNTNRAGQYTVFSVSELRFSQSEDENIDIECETYDKPNQTPTATPTNMPKVQENKPLDSSNAPENSAAKEVIDKCEAVVGHKISQRTKQEIYDYLKCGMTHELILAVIDYAQDMGKVNTNYIRGVLNNLKNEGIMTLAAWNAKQSQRKSSQNQSNVSFNSRSKFNNYENTNKTDYAAIEDKLLDLMMMEG